jgi:uncharacterized Tic20 family protein
MKAFNEDTGVEISEPIPFFLLFVISIILILVGISVVVTFGAVVTLVATTFTWIWYKLIFRKNGTTK